MRRGLLLGLDVGTTRIKAVALDAGGVERAGASVPTPFAASGRGGEASPPAVTLPTFYSGVATISPLINLR